MMTAKKNRKKNYEQICRETFKKYDPAFRALAAGTKEEAEAAIAPARKKVESK